MLIKISILFHNVMSWSVFITSGMNLCVGWGQIITVDLVYKRWPGLHLVKVRPLTSATLVLKALAIYQVAFPKSNRDGALISYQVHNSVPAQSSFRPVESPKLNESGPTLFFSHGWPMSSRMFEHFILPLCRSHRCRCIAFDRWGFGKSERTGDTPEQQHLVD